MRNLTILFVLMTGNVFGQDVLKNAIKKSLKFDSLNMLEKEQSFDTTEISYYSKKDFIYWYEKLEKNLVSELKNNDELFIKDEIIQEVVDDYNGFRIGEKLFENFKPKMGKYLNKDKTKLYEVHYENILISELLKSSKQHYKGIGNVNIKELRDSLNKVESEYSLVPLSAEINWNIENNKQFVALPIYYKINNIFKKIIDDNLDWIEYWLWYTKGEVKLNPFPFSFPDSLNTKSKILQAKSKIESDIKFIESDIKFYEARISVAQIQKEEFEKLKNTLDSLYSELTNRNSLLSSFVQFEKWYDEVSTRRTALYKTTQLPISDKNKINWIMNYDAQNNLNQIPNSLIRKLKKPYSVYGDDELVVAVHFIEKDTKVNLTSRETKFDVVSKLESEIVKPLIYPVEEAISFTEKTVQGGIADIQNLENLKKNRALAINRLKWMEQQTNPISEIVLKDNDTPKYRTELFYPERKLANIENKKTYTIYANSKKDSLVLSDSYFKYKKVHFLPTVGVGFYPQMRLNSIYNETTKVFETDRFYNNVELFAGVKWYPFGINRSSDRKTSRYIRRKFNNETFKLKGSSTNFNRGNSWLNRVSATFSLGTSKQFLRNYNIGLGWDPIPGFNLQAGYNIYIQNTYEISNGLIKDQSIRPKGAFYTGISVDLGIANQISKLFTK